MKVLITGASGRTSGYVLKALLRSPSPPDLRLFVRSEAAVQKLTSQHPRLSPADFALGDFLEAGTLPPALDGIDVVFHNAPVFHPNEGAMGIALIDAAKAAGVKHFVYCSVLFPILTKMQHHKVKRDIEEYLIESGLNYTILEPSSFMQNIDLQATLRSSTITAGYSQTTLQGFLDLGDLADIAAKVILDPAPHNRARYELVGENCSMEDIARKLSAHLGKEIAVQKATEHPKLPSGYMVETMDRMLFYYDRRGIPGNNNVTRWLLGREPTTWKALIQREAKA
ncbi:NAD-P-binding protein [Fomitopsis serialis]|uniref:NAD-P-binding protein n=1 Tax=Fomitopsis serialis TaxID=139415 RepID=UPI002007CDD4|nr:NAD-P-binding protein [Neoantrodia serialis]KAH9935772.1 NAD-P-binding protein [Neoantrodia serialis]